MSNNAIITGDELKKVMRARTNAELVVLLKNQNIPFSEARGGIPITTLNLIEKAAENKTGDYTSASEDPQPQTVRLIKNATQKA